MKASTRKRTKKPTVEQQLRESIAFHQDTIRRLQDENEHLRRRERSNAEIAVARQEELDAVHSILDGAPSAPHRHMGLNRNAAVRLGGWLASMRDGR